MRGSKTRDEPPTRRPGLETGCRAWRKSIAKQVKGVRKIQVAWARWVAGRGGVG